MNDTSSPLPPVQSAPARHFFAPLKIRGRLAVAFGVQLALVAGVALGGLVGLSTVKKSFESAITNGLEVERLAGEIRNEMLEARCAEKDFLLGWSVEGYRTAVAKYAVEHRRHVARIREIIAQLERAQTANRIAEAGQRIIEDLVTVKPYLNLYDEDFQSAVAAIGKRAAGFEKVTEPDPIAAKIEDFRAAAKVIEPLVADIAIVGQQDAAAEIAEAQAATRRTVFIVTISLVMAVLTGLGLAVGLGHQITTPLRTLARTAEEIGAGNLNVRAAVGSRDEIGTLAATFNAMAHQVRELVGSLEQRVLERERAEAQVRFLAEAGAALAESLDYQGTLAKVVRLALPHLADWCVVDAVDRNGEIHRVAAAHRDPEKEKLLQQIRERQSAWGTPPRSSIEAIEQGAPVLVTDVTEASIAKYVDDPEVKRILREVGIRSRMTIPLVARGRPLGAMSFISDRPDRRYGPAELAMAEELARRAATAIDNARLYGEAQEAIRARDDFLSIASHELNTPIASLRLMVQTMEQKDVVLAPEVLKRTIKLVSRQSNRLTRLVDELLNVARIQAGHLHIELDDVDLAAVIQEVVERLTEEIKRSKCQLSVTAPASIIGRWDRSRLEQVVTNLLSNALKFAAAKPIRITLHDGADKAILAVADEGIGIPPERLPHVFGRFERAVGVTEYSGLGLGLYIVHEIIYALGGTISVESTVGAGSRFTIELPKAGPPHAQAANSDHAS